MAERAPASVSSHDPLAFEQVQGYRLAVVYASVITPSSLASSGTPSAVTWNAARRNASALWSSGAKTKLTARSSGVYKVGAFLDWGANTTGERLLWLRLNGSTLFAGNSTTPLADGSPLSTEGLIDMQVGDYVEAIAAQTSGGGITPTGFFTAVRVSPL